MNAAREMEAEDIRTVRIAVEILPAEVRDDYIGDAWEKLREVKDLPGDKVKIVKRCVENKWREAERIRLGAMGCRQTRALRNANALINDAGEHDPGMLSNVNLSIGSDSALQARAEPQRNTLMDIVKLPKPQRDILIRIAHGRTFDDIAKTLHIAKKTIVACLCQIREKFAA